MFKEELKLVPNKPGSYQMYNKDNIIIYVGKAKDLKNRLSSYFHGTHSGKTKKMISEIKYFKYIITDTELESFILELNLIKEYSPKYNILLRDDKSYPYIEYTKKPYPELKVVRYLKIKPDKNKIIFGPYVNVLAARSVVNLLNRLYPLKKCKGKSKSPCLYYHIGECLGYCFKDVSYEEIKPIEDEVISFLKGNDEVIKNKIKEKIKEYSDNMNYELALSMKNELDNIDIIKEKQKVELHPNDHLDVIGHFKYKEYLGIEIMFVRGGKLNGSFSEILKVTDNYIEELEAYLGLFYNKNEIPKQILLNNEINKTLLEEIIKTKLFTPLKGAKKKLLDLAIKNAKINTLNNYEIKENKIKRSEGANFELSKLLNININRIEIFDNSNLFGSFSVSGMVTFINGYPSKANYRKYKTQENINDDYKTMKDLIYRRYYKVLLEKTEKPDLIIVDGSKGQINAALESLNELNLNIKVCGLAKDDNHKTHALIDGDTLKAYDINKTSNLFHYLTKMQDEVHRYTITYHRELRSKASITSALDKIPGIGPKRKKELLKHFKTIKNIKEASIEELTKIIPEKTAKELKDKLK